MGGNPPKQQKPRLNQTTYMVHAPSSIERLRRTSYRHSLEQASVEPYRFVPSPFLCLSRPDCLSFTSIWFEADCSFIILWQVMVSLRSEIGLAGSVDWVRFAMWFAPKVGPNLSKVDERRGGVVSSAWGWVLVAASVACNVCEGHQMVLAERVACMHLQFVYFYQTIAFNLKPTVAVSF